jgi:hypothetical protein
MFFLTKQSPVNVLETLAPDDIIDLLRKSFRHREHGENEFFSKISVGSVARQRVTYARGLINKL